MRATAAGTLLLASAILVGCADESATPRPTETGQDSTRAASVRDSLVEANEAFQQARFDDAIRIASDAVQMHPDDEIGFQQLSSWLAQLERHQDAIDLFAQFDGNNPFAYRFRGRHQALSGDYDSALTTLEECIDRHPQAVGCRMERATLNQSLGDFASVVTDLRLAHELSPSDRSAAMLATALRVTGDYAGSAELLEEALQRSPQSIDLKLARIHLWLRDRRFEEAEGALRALSESEPRNETVQRQLAALLLRTERPDEGNYRLALADLYRDYNQTYRQLMAQVAATREARAALMLGELDLTVGRYDEALRWLQMAESGGASKVRAAAAQAWGWYALGEMERGDRQLNALTNDERERSAHIQLALAARAARTGDSDEARLRIERAIQTGPVERSFLRRAADLYSAIGETERARDTLLRAATAAFP